MIKNLQFLSVVTLPIYYLIPIRDAGLTICPFFHLSGIPCPGCGMGRSLVHIFHLDFIGALYYNPFGYVVFFVQMYLLAGIFFPFLLTSSEKKNRILKMAEINIAVFFLLYGVIRIWAFTQNDPVLSPYFYDFNRTFSLMRWVLYGQ